MDQFSLGKQKVNQQLLFKGKICCVSKAWIRNCSLSFLSGVLTTYNLG